MLKNSNFCFSDLCHSWIVLRVSPDVDIRVCCCLFVVCIIYIDYMMLGVSHATQNKKKL